MVKWQTLGSIISVVITPQLRVNNTSVNWLPKIVVTVLKMLLSCGFSVVQNSLAYAELADPLRKPGEVGTPRLVMPAP